MWECTQLWLEKHSLVVSMAFSLFLVLATISNAIVACLIKKLSKQSLKPVVVLEERHISNSFQLCLHNVGNGPALNIKGNITVDSKLIESLPLERLRETTLSSLNRNIKGPFNLAADQIQELGYELNLRGFDESSKSKIRFSIEYEDIFGKRGEHIQNANQIYKSRL